METPILTLFGGVLLSGAACLAGDPVADFVHELRQERNHDDVWWVEQSLDPAPPKGGYLFRMELDMNGDGVKELFLATSRDCDRHGYRWTLYRKGADGDYHKVDLIVFGLYPRMKVVNGIRQYSLYHPRKERDGGAYFSIYWMDEAGALHEEERVLTEDEKEIENGEDPDTQDADGNPVQAKIDAKLKMGTTLQLQVQKVTLGKYLQNKDTPWRPAILELQLDGQQHDPADAADIASLKNWTPPPPPPPPPAP